MKKEAQTSEQLNIDAYKKFDPRTTPLPKSTRGWFAEGFMTPILGLKMLLQYKGLLWYFLLPVFLQTVMSLALLGVMYLIAQVVFDWGHWLVGWVTGSAADLANLRESPSIDTVNKVADVAVIIVIGFVFAYLYLLFWRISGGILTGYFGGRLTDKAIQAAGLEFDAKRKTTVLGEVANGVFHAVAMVLPQPVFGTLAFIPVVGTLVAAVVTSGYVVFLTGYGELRDPLEKMGMSRLDALRVCSQNKAATTGLGLAKMSSEPVPLVGGIVQASESLGRIALALRVVKASESKKSEIQELA